MKEEFFERITPEMKDAAEKQIAEHHKIIDYDTREYPVEVIVDKYLSGIEDDENDFYVPDYQRDLTWPDPHQSRFIESVLMGLPIPLLFFADVAGKEGRAEIVDGSQRVRTLARFMQGKLRLEGLERLVVLGNMRNHQPKKLLIELNALATDIVTKTFRKDEIFSGNVDARVIQEVAKQYGFPEPRSRGYRLLTVKTQRNDLAHGSKSFAEVGRSFSVPDIVEIKGDVVAYLTEMLGNVSDYLISKSYLLEQAS